MVGCRPEAAYGEEKVSVGLKIDADLTRVFVSQGGSQRCRQSVPETASFIFPQRLIKLRRAKEEQFFSCRRPMGEDPVLVFLGPQPSH